MALLTKTESTQDLVPIKEIRDGVVVLNDGGMRMVLIASSINFALKSYDEQTAILLQYQNFLNSIDFPLQIFVNSRELDIRPYLATLDERLKEQTAELLKIQVREYIEFIKSFVESTDIMTKSFFVVVPYDPAIMYSTKKSGIWPFGKKETDAEANQDFQTNKSQLEQRVSVVKQGLNSMGIRLAPLGTEELVELYFKLFNPGEVDTPKITR